MKLFLHQLESLKALLKVSKTAMGSNGFGQVDLLDLRQKNSYTHFLGSNEFLKHDSAKNMVSLCLAGSLDFRISLVTITLLTDVKECS